MQEFLQFAVYGILIGATYGLIAVPLGFAHTAFGIVDAAVGAYAALAGVVAVVVGGVLGVVAGVGTGVAASLVVAVVYRLLVKRRVADPIIIIAATFGIGLAIQSIILTQFGKDPVIAQLFSRSWRVGAVFLNPQQLVDFLVGLLVVAVLLIVLYKTSIGRQIRAGADNTTGALLAGISVVRNQYLIFATEGLLAGVGGILLAYTTGLDYTSVVTLTLNAFAAAVIFGMGGPLACFLGGVVIGFVESMVAGYVSNGVLTAGPYVFVILLLIFKRGSVVAGGRP